MSFRAQFLHLPLLAASALVASPIHASTAEDSRDVDHLIEAYHQAVVGHDRTRLAALFLGEGGAWVSVLSDEGLARVRAAKPDAPKLRPGGLANFLTMVATSSARLDPQHSNLQIRSDGTIATVTFDFRFLIDGKEQNRGSESWQLIKGGEGWRIVSIVYSSTPPGS